MINSLKYANVYESTIRPQINKWLKKVLLSFIGCSFLIVLTLKLLEFMGLSQKLTAVIFLPCGIFYVYQICSIKNIRCPICKKPLYFSLYSAKIPFKLNSLSGKSCNHCGARFG